MKNRHKMWSDKDEIIVRKEFNVTDINILAERLGRTPYAVIQHARSMGMSKTRVSKVWPPEKVEKLKQLYPNHTNEEIARILGSTPRSVNAIAFKLGLRKDPQWMYEKSSKGMFKKGHTPANKGKKWNEYLDMEKQEKIRATTFKKGNRPANKKPVGYERISRDGYIEVKVAEPNVFKIKQRVIWEQHNGPIPEGMHVCFKDGDKSNLDIENLFLENMTDKFNRCCSIHTRLPEDMRKLVQLKGALKRKINQIEKEENHGNRQVTSKGKGNWRKNRACR